MVNLHISVEGQTEEMFVKQLLVPHFLKKNIYITISNATGKIQTKKVKVEIKKLLKNKNINYITTLYDYYGYTLNNNEKKRLASEAKNHSNKKHIIESFIHDSVHENERNRVIPYIQMYEFEGLLFSNPKILANILPKGNLSGKIQQILKQFNSNPEYINNSQQTAPSKRLEKWNYAKSIHSREISQQTGLKTIREKCSGFNEWITKLENLT